MTPVSQLIWRNRERLSSKLDQRRLLLIRPPRDGLAARLRREGFRVDALCHSFATHQALQDAGLASGFGLVPPAGETWPLILLFQPREKALLDMMLDLCRGLVDSDGTLWLAGENRAGIKSAGKRLPGFFSEWRKADSARHCTLFTAAKPAIEPAFDLQSYFETWQIEVDNEQLDLHSLPGVFAHGRLDAGTRLLLDTLVAPPLGGSVDGRVLDFACGSGAIGLALAKRNPAIELTMLDDSALALESARRSLESNARQAELVASDGLAVFTAQGEMPVFDWIVSNPPFHSGVRQDLDVARRFVADCPGLLAPEGRLCLVANAHLPYRSWLPELFGEVQVLSADSEYNVWLARTRKT